MHWVQTETRLPLGSRIFCKLGYFLFLGVGLYLPRSFFRPARTIEPLPQISHLRIEIKYTVSNIKYQPRRLWVGAPTEASEVPKLWILFL